LHNVTLEGVAVAACDVIEPGEFVIWPLDGGVRVLDHHDDRHDRRGNANGHSAVAQRDA